MKKLLIIGLVIASNTFVCFAQKQTEIQARTDSLVSRLETLIKIANEELDQININTSLKNRYKLYPTENIYNFLLLDTKTGRIEQVQWSMKEEEEISVTINAKDLNTGPAYGSGSFELYPTKNIYQFILLDKTNGNRWHVQWGLKSKERWIRRMYK